MLICGQIILSSHQEDGSLKYRQDLTNKEISTGLKIVEVQKDIEYYTDMINSISKKDDSVTKQLQLPDTNKEKQEVLKIVTDKLANTQQRLMELIKDLNLFYDKINEKLYPQTEFYRINSFTVDNTKSISSKRFLMLMIITWILAEVLIIAITLISTGLSSKKTHN